MRFILITVLALAVADKRVSYEGFRVYRITPLNDAQLDLLNSLENHSEYDFWSKHLQINVDVDVMVAPLNQTQFEKLMDQNSLKYQIIIPNLESVVRKERDVRIKTRRKTVKGTISFTNYHSYAEIQSYLLTLQKNYPNIVKLLSAGKSEKGRDLTVVQISSNTKGNKPILFIDGGIHAREWIAPATALYTLQQLVEVTTNRQLLDNFDWHIIPLLNPDGYEYSRATDRFWRKNRTPNNGSSCVGTDLNRNFGDHWGGQGTSDDPCSEIYKGTSAFSVPESKALRNYLLSISGRGKLYLTLHSYGQYILNPWGYDYVLPEDAPALKKLGELVAASIKLVHNTTYTVGSSTYLLGPGAGGSDDWAKSGAGIEYSYTLELPGGGTSGFDLPPSRILPVGEETFAGVKTYYKNLSLLL